MTRLTPADRFWIKAVQDGECWRWTAELNNDGYPRFWVDRRKVLAHRWSYEHLVGQIPEGLQLDHLCRNRACVNPSHLEVVAHQENQARRIAVTACRKGHPFTPENTRNTARGRICRTCARALRRRDRHPRHQAAQRDQCLKGHPLVGDNAYTRPGRTAPECRICREQHRASWRAKRAA